VNLGWSAAQCAVSTTSDLGAPIGAPANLSLKPLSLRSFPDVLQTLGVPQAQYVRLLVSCDQPFYSFAMTRDEETGDIGFIGPAGSGNPPWCARRAAAQQLSGRRRLLLGSRLGLQAQQ
jgi:hypothetical protein